MTTSCMVRFGLFALALKAGAQFDTSGMDEQPFSSATDVKKGNTVNAAYITLERNYWLLDGNYHFMPPTNPMVGIMSANQSDASGVFAVVPELLISFVGENSTDGLALRFGEFSGDWCDEITVIFYDSLGAVIRSDTYNPTGVTFSTGQAVDGFQSILIRFISTNKPFRYMRLSGLDFGSIVEFTHADIKTASVLEQINFLSTELPYDTFSLSLYSSDSAFNVVNPTGQYASLKEKQPLDLFVTVDGARFLFGTFYLAKWTNKSRTSIDFSCIDAIGVMESLPDYMGGMYDGESVAVALDALFLSAGLIYSIEDYFADTTISGWIPVCNHREALQHIAFSIGAYVTCARAGVVQIKRGTLAADVVTPDYLLPQSVQSMEQELTLKSLVTGIQLYSHDYSEDTQVMEAYRGYMTAGAQKVIFDEPLHHLIVTGANIASRGANHVILEVVKDGQVVVSGKKYDVLEQRYAISTAGLDPSVKKNTIVIQSATLVSSEILQPLAERVYAYYMQRHLQTAKILNPETQTGSIVEYEALYDQTLTGTVERMDTDITGGYKANVVIVGVAA